MIDRITSFYRWKKMNSFLVTSVICKKFKELVHARLLNSLSLDHSARKSFIWIGWKHLNFGLKNWRLHFDIGLSLFFFFFFRITSREFKFVIISNSNSLLSLNF